MVGGFVVMVFTIIALQAPILPIPVQDRLTIATAIIADAALSFLGLGQQAPQPSWG
jgi:peptide/nickel transport system permease protein